ncbi:MAG: branched-chain amino acid ABC transporter permease [Rhodobiaceae bacterium]|nr:branched-chain amino acid ABC transporter permease [Rhodobiaceae bacterium]MCC0052103.1 branched-chain amino acid ABC transporter permease [Rhodobiaceae bacterium]MCC0061377.1 branched-chain amino acid ABC transporter permease [Rhodobiaceae bacterium]
MENTDDDSWHPLVEGDESRHDPMDRAAARDQRRFLTIALIGLAVLIALPFVVGDYYVSLFSEILIFGILVSGVNLLLGYTGLVSLGHASFMGLGAYVTAIAASLLGYPVWLSMLASILISLLIAYGVGLLSVRTKGVQFLLITLAFGQMFHAIAEKTRFTGGDDGMTNIPRIDLGFIGLDADQDRVFYFFVLVCFVVAMLILRRVVESPFGRVLVGIRENEKRMLAMGYTTFPYKALAFGISGMLAGLAGSLWVQHGFFVNPHIMTWELSGEALLMVIIGGSQSFFGPVLGAAFYVLAKDLLSEITEAYLMFFGLIFVLVVAFFQGGLAGFASRFAERFLNRKSDGGEDKP